MTEESQPRRSSVWPSALSLLGLLLGGYLGLYALLFLDIRVFQTGYYMTYVLCNGYINGFLINDILEWIYWPLSMLLRWLWS